MTEPVMLTFQSPPDQFSKGDNEIQNPHPIPNGRFPYFGHYFNVFRVRHNTLLLIANCVNTVKYQHKWLCTHCTSLYSTMLQVTYWLLTFFLCANVRRGGINIALYVTSFLFVVVFRSSGIMEGILFDLKLEFCLIALASLITIDEHTCI